jgi:hypothetical protein
MKEEAKRPRWILPAAGCLGAVAGAVPGALMLLAVLFWALTYEVYGGSRTGIGLLVFAGIPLATAGGAVGALLGFLLGWIGRSIGRKMTGKHAEAIATVLGGLLGGVMAAAAVYVSRPW